MTLDDDERVIRRAASTDPEPNLTDEERRRLRKLIERMDRWAWLMGGVKPVLAGIVISALALESFDGLQEALRAWLRGPPSE